MLPLRSLRLATAALSLVAVLLVFAFSSGLACGEEAIVLDNGAVLRGTVVKEEGGHLVFRLSGVGSDSRITISRERIAQRFTTIDPKAWATGSKVVAPNTALPVLTPTMPAAGTAAPSEAAPLPEEEPEVQEEGFFVRTARRAVVAFPTDPSARAILASLAVVVLLCLVGLGGKMADLKGLTLGKSTILALLLGAMVTVDARWGASLLRADRAAVVLPVELFAWVGAAAYALRCGFGRAFQLFAFVLLAGTLVTFSTGAVLVLA